MIKICFLVYNCSNYGGVETVTSNLVNELSKHYEVAIASILDDGRPNMIPTNPGIEVTKLIPGGTRLRDQQLKLFRPLKRYLKDHNIDIVFTMGQYSGFLAAPVSLVSKATFIFCDHGALINQWHDKKTTLMRFIASKASKKVVVLTEKSYKDYIDRFHMKSEKMSYIYNWIEPTDFDSDQYDISSHKLLSAGRLGQEKGFNQLIDAMRLVAEKHPEWTLDIYGDGEEEENLKNRISELKLGEIITLKGHTDHIREYYKNYAVYVMPSYREGLPLTLLEAKINMLPIVAFDVETGPREIVRDGVDGLLVEPKNIEQLAEKICILIDNPEMRIRMAQQAKGNISKFSKESILCRWIELIDEVGARKK